MSWYTGLPGILSQNNKKYTWYRYNVTRVMAITETTEVGHANIASLYYYANMSFYPSGDIVFCLSGKNSSTSDGYVYHIRDNLTYSTDNYTDPQYIGDGITVYRYKYSYSNSAYTFYTREALSYVNGQGSYIDTVSSTETTAYPINGIQDGYWYVLQTTS